MTLLVDQIMWRGGRWVNVNREGKAIRLQGVRVQGVEGTRIIDRGEGCKGLRVQDI
jgi:hypothetical protein